ncbi:secretin receptor-like, partial [Ascaphus truei]|uniref:secretin receptor-like n=1 Tax=Ascaphus truei TaxID=8439 RepID=UPI003F5A2933
MWTFALAILFGGTLHVRGVQLLCDLLGVMRKEEEACSEALAVEAHNVSDDRWTQEGCAGVWDNLSCWPTSPLGHTVSTHCPEILQIITGHKGFVHRNCTADGWSATFPPVDVACKYDVNDTAIEEI